MTAANDITGDLIKTKKYSKVYVDNYDLAFHSEKTKEFYEKEVRGGVDQEWDELSIEDRKQLIAIYLEGGY